jgi:hypothetical protein
VAKLRVEEKTKRLHRSASFKPVEEALKLPATPMPRVSTPTKRQTFRNAKNMFARLKRKFR